MPFSSEIARRSMASGAATSFQYFNVSTLAVAAAPVQIGFIMAWILLFVAGLFEIAWAIGLKFTNGFTRFWPTFGTIIALCASIGLLGLASKSLPIGNAYAVWTGIGAVGTVICGIAFLGDPVTPARLACVALILIGIIGLRFT